MSMFEGLSIITGAVNETDSLMQTVLQLLSEINHKDLKEIIIVCSQYITPECRAVVDEISRKETDVPFVIFTQKGHKLSAIKEGIEICKGSHSMVIAADLAENIDVIPALIEYEKEHPDEIASTSRWLKDSRFYGYNRVRMVLNYLAQIYLRILYQSRLTDLTNPVQIAPTGVYQSINFESDEYVLLLEMVLKPLRLGCRFKEFPVNCYARTQGKSGNSFLKTLAYLPASLKIRFMSKSKLLK